MGTGASELTLDQLADLGTYNNVIFFNDPSDTDLIKTIAGSPRTILINLGQFLNIGAGEVQGDAIADELTASQIGDGALSADAAGRAIIASGFFNAATILDKMIPGVSDPGRIAVGRVDFSATGTAAVVVTVGTQTYTEVDVPTSTDGEWTNGASAANSATSLAAGINDDTRAGNDYAAVVSGGTVFIVARVPGVAGNVTVSDDQAQPDANENLVGGVDASVKQELTILHTVTAEEADAVEVIIPLPFDVDFFEFHLYDANGGILATEITDRGTVVAAAVSVPAYFRLATNGATHVSTGDILRLTVQE